jgi:hypothetical protein
LPFDFDIGLIHPPAAPDGPLAAVERLFELRAIFQDPALEKRYKYALSQSSKFA